MATTLKQLVEALKFMADQQAQLGAMLLQHQQKSPGGEAQKFSKDWADVVAFRNVKVFSGDSREWESEKQ